MLVQEQLEAWARLRFSVVGPLLAAPPPHGDLKAELKRLADKEWQHPTSGKPVRFAWSTIERWFYQARSAKRDPVGALKRRTRSDAGEQASVPLTLREAIRTQHRQHPGWSYQLHFDNAMAWADEQQFESLPSYATIRRFMKFQGLTPRRRPRTAGQKRAAQRREQREIRSYEAEFVNGLWHADFHHGSRRVLTAHGAWKPVFLLGFMDDHSRLACHLQWYLAETAETFVHGLCQAIQKRRLPRALMTDNGGPMLSAETLGGLHRLGIVHQPTLPYSPYQNGKQEAFWGQVEGRLLPMLEGVEDLTLELLNQATCAWLEEEYQRKEHSEIGTSPLDRFVNTPDVGRDSPNSEALRDAFRQAVSRKQRKSDGSISLEGRRFEVPARYRTFDRIHLYYARWDFERIHMFDPRTGTVLCRLYPQDKTVNANGLRRQIQTGPPLEQGSERSGEMAPLLRKLMADYSATGLPPAYLPHSGHEEENLG